jgi:RNA polymerase II subunit A small phosphatase-like protein
LLIENAIDCSSFIDDPRDLEMWQIADFLIEIKDAPDVRAHCRYVL